MDKDIIDSAFLQYLAPINFDKINHIISFLSLDKYVKKLTTERFLIILIFGQLFSIKSLSHLSEKVIGDEDLQQLLGMDSISTAQLSRKLREIPPELMHLIFNELVKRTLAEKGANFVRNNFNNLHIIDSSTISMALSQYPWAEFRKTKAGIKIHLRIVFDDKTGVIPDKVVISPAKGADRTKMDDLVITTAKNALHVFDRGYVDYKKFDEYTDNSTLFVSRLKSNAVIKVIKSEKKIIDGKEITDSIVRLGTEGINQMRNNLRLLEIPDDNDPDKIIRIITNDLERSTKEISDIYRNRWQIELFFKWIKQHLHVKVFYGFSENAVKVQIWLALITYLLLSLLKKEVKTHKSLLTVQRMLDTYKYKPLKKFIKKLKRPPSRRSRGRKKIDYDKIFKYTYRQVMAGETELLNDDTVYDPVIL